MLHPSFSKIPGSIRLPKWQLLTFPAGLAQSKGLEKSSLASSKAFLTTRKNTKQSITKYVQERYKMNHNTNASRISGLYVGGDMTDRTRRYVPKDNPATEIVTHTIQDNNNRKLYVDNYAPDSYHDIREQVCLPVYIKPYTSLCFMYPEKTSSKGEHF